MNRNRTIKKYISLTITEQYLFSSMIRNELDSLIQLYRAFRTKCMNGSITNKVDYQVKKNGEYGYYPNTHIIPIIKYIEENDIKSILDLGSGSGIFLKLLNQYTNVEVMGYENEKKLVDLSNRFKVPTLKKNIITLKKQDIQDYQVIYFWEPLYDNKLAQKFANNLVNILSKDQIIIYKGAGSIGHYLDLTKKLDIVDIIEGYTLYKLKE